MRERFLILMAGLALLAIAAPVSGRQMTAVSGDYSGTLGPLHLKLHVKTDNDGHLTGTLDSIDQGATGLACSNFKLEGKNLSFDVPSVSGTWRGTVEDNGASLNGTWSQGMDAPLVLKRDEPFEAASKPTAVDGIWLGTLKAGGQELRIQLHVRSDRAGKEYCTLDSLDQSAVGLDCTKATFSENDFSFDVPAVQGTWKGTLSTDTKQLNGNWSQGSPLPLNFVRKTSEIAMKTASPVKYDPAKPPVTASDLKTVLNADLAPALKDGALAPGTGAGIVIGVIEHGARNIYAYGTAKPDSIFEIGSISKTFTGLILAQMVEQAKVKLDEPVRDLLSPGTVTKRAGAELTLLDLATQHSGLPFMPDNLRPADPGNPFADYRATDLYALLAKHGLAKPEPPKFLYSNVGFGLLGQALANRAKMPYPELLANEVTGPLQLKDTVVKLSPEQQKRFIQGHNAQHHEAHAWDLDALSGAGAIRSTASDMLSYLSANLHPDSLPVGSSQDSPAGTLHAALILSHELRADAFPGMKIALAWFCKVDTGTYWHNGATGGYSGYALFNPKGDYAAIVLFNTTFSGTGSFADRVGEHVNERLSGKPAISLGP